MIFRAICKRCEQEFFYTCHEESKFVTPVCCGAPTIYEEKRKDEKRDEAFKAGTDS